MKNALKFVIALIVTTLLMLAFRALAFTVYAVDGTDLEPCFVSGDRVLVNRWSYGLRTGGSPMFRYVRWLGSPVRRNDAVAFNDPFDSIVPPRRREVCIGYCRGVPGDTVKMGNVAFKVPGKRHSIGVSAKNANLLAFIYNRYEGRRAEVVGGKLLVDGVETCCAFFSNDYYWFDASQGMAAANRGFSGLVPEDHVIGRVSVLLYSIDSSLPFFSSFRPGRWLLLVGSGAR